MLLILNPFWISLQVGIVGRTGAGKSSVFSAVFRLSEPEGLLWVDQYRIELAGLHNLRKKMSIILQVCTSEHSHMFFLCKAASLNDFNLIFLLFSNWIKMLILFPPIEYIFSSRYFQQIFSSHTRFKNIYFILKYG